MGHVGTRLHKEERGSSAEASGQQAHQVAVQLPADQEDGEETEGAEQGVHEARLSGEDAQAQDERIARRIFSETLPVPIDYELSGEELWLGGGLNEQSASGEDLGLVKESVLVLYMGQAVEDRLGHLSPTPEGGDENDRQSNGDGNAVATLFGKWPLACRATWHPLVRPIIRLSADALPAPRRRQAHKALYRSRMTSAPILRSTCHPSVFCPPTASPE